MITLAMCRRAFVSLRNGFFALSSLGLAFALVAPADAAHHGGPGSRETPPAVTIQLGGARGNEPLKTFLFPSHKPRPAASPTTDLPFFVNPLVRRRIAVTPAVPATPAEAADAI